MKTRKVNTAQLDDKLYILNGHDSIRYVDLTKYKVHQYKPPKQLRRWMSRLLFKLHIIRNHSEGIFTYHYTNNVSSDIRPEVSKKK